MPKGEERLKGVNFAKQVLDRFGIDQERVLSDKVWAEKDGDVSIGKIKGDERMKDGNGEVVDGGESKL